MVERRCKKRILKLQQNRLDWEERRQRSQRNEERQKSGSGILWNEKGSKRQTSEDSGNDSQGSVIGNASFLSNLHSPRVLRRIQPSDCQALANMIPGKFMNSPQGPNLSPQHAQTLGSASHDHLHLAPCHFSFSCPQGLSSNAFLNPGLPTANPVLLPVQSLL